MYDIYINYFMDDSSPNMISTERKMYSVPITENKENALTDPVVKTEMGKTGTFEFSVAPDHPYYNSWLQMKTVMRVEFSGETIFRGRVLTIDNQPMTGIKRIHLEGDFAFLMDSYQEGVPDDERTEKSVETYLSEVIAAHNSQMNVAGSMHKKMTLGIVPGTYDQNGTPDEQRVKGDTRKYEESSWRQTTDALGNLQKEFGGYFRTRYNKSNGVCYLDWLEQCYSTTVNTQPIELTENLIDINSSTEVDNLFTVLVPVGSSEGKPVYIDGYNGHSGKAITVPEVAAYYVSAGKESELSRRYHSKAEYENAIYNYGIIYKTQSFSNADTQEKLWNYATDWVKDNYMGGISSFTISALDCHHIDPVKQKYLTGDLVWVIYPNMAYKTHGGSRLIEKTLTITSVKYDLYHPEKDEYTVGIPNGVISKTYGTANKKSASKSSISGSVGETIGPVGGSLPKVDYERKATGDELERLAWKYVFDGSKHSDKYQELKERNPEAAKSALQMTYAAILRDITPEDDPEYRAQNNQIDSILFDGPKAKMLIQKSIPKEVQQLLVAQGKLDPSKMPTAETREKLDAAIEIVADEYVSKLSLEEQIKIDPRMVVTDKVRAAQLLLNKGDRKTGLDIALETGLLKDPSNLAPCQRPAANMRLTRLVQGAASVSDPYGISNATSKVAANIDGDIATMSSEVLTLGTQGLTSSATTWFSGFEGLLKLVSPSDAGNFDTSKLKGMWNTVTGAISTVKGIFGTNGSGGKGTVVADGSNAKVSITPTSSAGVSGEETVQLDGSGQVKAGKSGNAWQITLNSPITYVDSKGVSHTLNAGAVRAEDFQLYSGIDPVDSLACKFAYFDTVVVVDLYAVKAYVDDISSERIHANRYIRAGQARFNVATAEQRLAAPLIELTNVNGGDTASLGNCFSSCLPSMDNGKLKLTFGKIGGGTVDTAPFDITATTWYKNKISDAIASGRNDVYLEAEHSTIDPGGSTYVRAYYGNHNATGAYCTVSASQGGGGAPTVDLNGAGFSYTEYDSAPKVDMIKENGVIYGHIWYRKDNGKWAYLRAFSIGYPT